MARSTTAADKIEANLKSGAKAIASTTKKASSSKHNPIKNLGDWAHPPKKKK